MSTTHDRSGPHLTLVHDQETPDLTEIADREQVLTPTRQDAAVRSWDDMVGVGEDSGDDGALPSVSADELFTSGQVTANDLDGLSTAWPLLGVIEHHLRAGDVEAARQVVRNFDAADDGEPARTVEGAAELSGIDPAAVSELRDAGDVYDEADAPNQYDDGDDGDDLADGFADRADVLDDRAAELDDEDDLDDLDDDAAGEHPEPIPGHVPGQMRLDLDLSDDISNDDSDGIGGWEL